jgi:probable rRNA maturation factor
VHSRRKEKNIMQEHPLIELYVNLSDAAQNSLVEETLASVDLDGVVRHTLAAVHITQEVMLTLLITDDDGIREMNKQYREQNKPTDVLSFPLMEKPLVDAPEDQLWVPQAEEGAQEGPVFVNPPDMVTNLGDVVISWPTIVRQAASAGHEPITELIFLFSHGILHLVGYDDQTEEGYNAMVHIQNSVLVTMGQKAYQG